jgi:hypothetical protein
MEQGRAFNVADLQNRSLASAARFSPTESVDRPP